MRIKLLISVAGDTYSHVPGDIVDWADDAARAYVAEGYAEVVTPENDPILVGDPNAPAPQGFLAGAALGRGKRR